MGNLLSLDRFKKWLNDGCAKLRDAGMRRDAAEVISLDEYHSFVDSGLLTHIPKIDAGENMFFARQLEAFKAKLFNTKYPELLARLLLPVSYDAGPGAKKITYRAYTLVGIAQAITNYAADLARADAFGQEFTSNVRDYGEAFGWNIREIQSSAQAERSGIGPTMPLQTGRMMACRRAHEVNLDNIAFAGDVAFGLIGLNNIPSANTYAVPAGAAGSTLWANKTPDEMLADLFAMESTPLSNSSEVEYATRLLLPPAKYRMAAYTRVSIASDTSVLDYFLKQSRYIKDVRGWWKLTGAGSGGLDRMLSYRPDSDTISLEIPEEFTTLPPEPRNLEVVVNTTMAIGGVICEFPLSVTYGDGI